MLNTKHIALIAIAAVAAVTSPAVAGTKYGTNLVSNSAVDPPANPTLSPKSQIKGNDKGVIQISLVSVTDGFGVAAESSTSFKDTGTLDGTEYTVIVKLYIPSLTTFIPSGIVEVPVPVDLKSGKGKTKRNLGSLFALIPPGAGRTAEVRASEVWGPLGSDNVEACQAILDGLAVSLTENDPTCRGGTQFGMSGMAVPLPK